MNIINKTAEGVATGAREYLTFRLGAGSYGVQVSSVREIVRLLPITAVPQMPPSMRGVVNLRERVIPVTSRRSPAPWFLNRPDQRDMALRPESTAAEPWMAGQPIPISACFLG